MMHDVQNLNWDSTSNKYLMYAGTMKQNAKIDCDYDRKV